jgi:hypothetical protein
MIVFDIIIILINDHLIFGCTTKGAAGSSSNPVALIESGILFVVSTTYRLDVELNSSTNFIHHIEASEQF